MRRFFRRWPGGCSGWSLRGFRGFAILAGAATIVPRRSWRGNWEAAAAHRRSRPRPSPSRRAFSGRTGCSSRSRSTRPRRCSSSGSRCGSRSVAAPGLRSAPPSGWAWRRSTRLRSRWFCSSPASVHISGQAGVFCRRRTLDLLDDWRPARDTRWLDGLWGRLSAIAAKCVDDQSSDGEHLDEISCVLPGCRDAVSGVDAPHPQR